MAEGYQLAMMELFLGETCGSDSSGKKPKHLITKEFL